MIARPWATAGHRPRSNSPAMDRFRCASAAVAAFALTACTASSDEVQPKEGSIFFPTGLAVSPNDSYLFIASANSDLRYDSGTIEVADVAEVERVVSAWKDSETVPDGCTAATDGSGTLECPPADFLLPNAAVRIGNFAATIAVQDLDVQDSEDRDLRLIVPVRGDPSVTWIDWDGEALSCSTSQGFELCNDDHRLTRLRNDSDLPAIVDEPYGVYVDSVGEFAMVTHLTTGTVTLVDSPADGSPVLADTLTGLFAANSSGLRGATGVAGRQPGDDNIVYVQSRSEDRIQMMSVARPAGASPYLIPTGYFFLDAVGGAGGGGTSDDSRGIAFNATGTRAFMVNRSPPSLQIYDTSPDRDGAPRNQLLGATDICRETSSVVVGDGGPGERVFVGCFNDGELYVVDPRAGVDVEAVTVVGSGPFGLALAPTRQLLFVSNFLENSLAVIDLDPESPTLYRVILRIGDRS